MDKKEYLEYHRQYRVKNKEKIAKKSKIRKALWYISHKKEAYNRHKKWKENNWERMRSSIRKHQKTPKGIYNSIKVNAKVRGISVCSRDKFLDWYNNAKKICVYCDLPVELLEFDVKGVSRNRTRLSIDRKDNGLGYEIGNMVICCNTCNIVKNNIFTYEEMLYIGMNFIKPKWQEKRAEADDKHS